MADYTFIEKEKEEEMDVQEESFKKMSRSELVQQQTIEELQEQIQELVQQHEQQKQKHLLQIRRLLKQQVRENTPDRVGAGIFIRHLNSFQPNPPIQG